MDQSGHAAAQGPSGRRFNVAHRRTPSELTPLMMEQLAIQQQIDLLQAQQQHIAAQHQQYVNMGMIQPQQQLPGFGMQGQMSGMSPNANTFQQLQQLQQQHLGIPMGGGPGGASSHRRNQSAMPNVSLGPPPARSTGASGSSFGEFDGANRSENVNPRGNRSGPPGAGHARRHSLALPEAKKAAELAEQKRKPAGFQFPVPGTQSSVSTIDDHRASSPLTEDASRSFSGGVNARAGNRGGVHAKTNSLAAGRGGAGPARGSGGFQFPSVTSANDAGGNTSPGADFSRRGSQGHGRNQSRNFDGNWRQQANNTQQASLHDQQASNMGSFSLNQSAGAAPFQPGHRARGSMNQSISSMGSFQFPQQPLLQLPQSQLLMQQPQLFAGGGQGLNQLQLAQLQALQMAQAGSQGMGGLSGSQHNQWNSGQMSNQQSQQQQRKTLFTPYLPQATLPALLSDGQLVQGILRVNKKNRSDAYVTTTDLDADIFICGSKDRNRALEGDCVAIELLDVDEVWGAKRDKEEKKKRKDISDTRSGSTAGLESHGDSSQSGNAEGGIRRRGSLRQRPTQKKNDDVEVEGQSLLLMEEEEISDEAKPLYAGHVVAVIERVAGQMFSGTLGLLRPSSQATKEKQEAERQAREGSQGRPQNDRQTERPKIVWFKPTDKRVPLIAIPTEQAPKDFVERHQEYANRICVASIKRWPITSLHPFGTLVEWLGEMGDLKAETDALLRDNNFAADEFSGPVLQNVGFEEWSVANDGEDALENRRDFRDEKTFTIDPNGSKELDDAVHFKSLGDDLVEIGIHVADVAHFVKANSLVDREAKKRGTGVYLMNRTVNMLPSRLSAEICCLSPGEERYTISVVFTVNSETGSVLEDKTWIGKAVIKSSGKVTYDQVDAVVQGTSGNSLDDARSKEIKRLYDLSRKLRRDRFGGRFVDIPPLRLLYGLDDELIPVEENIFNSSCAHELIEELSHLANAFVARTVFRGLGQKALMRSHASPNPRRLQTFAERMTRIGYDIDTSSSAALQHSLFSVDETDVRRGMETLLFKTMRRAKYTVASQVTDESELAHFALNLPLYTHFTNPSRRYADIIVHRQLEAVLSKGDVEFNEDIESLVKTAEMCNTKKDSAQSAQEQSVHIESCRALDRKRQELKGDLISEGVVICVYESAFDVLISEFGFEKRVHCDQLPLKKAEFDKNKRVLELYWEKGVPSSTYIPEDERQKQPAHRGSAFLGRNNDARAKASMAQRRQTDTSMLSNDDVDALFDEDDDIASEITEMAAGVSLNAGDRPTQSMPPSPTTKNGNSAGTVNRTRSDSRIARPSGDLPEARLTNKEKYLSYFKLREEGGEYIQDVTEMTRVPVILKTDLTKSPPCLTIRSLNPYAL